MLNLDHINIHHPLRYAEQGYPWAEWDLLRREAPIFWYERDDIEPFWAITRYDDVKTISGHPGVFINGGPQAGGKLFTDKSGDFWPADAPRSARTTRRSARWPAPRH